MTIRLRTNDRKFIADARIPNFKTLPDVVLWGQRIFGFPEPGEPVTYREVFAVYATNAASLPANTPINDTGSGEVTRPMDWIEPKF